MAYKEEHIKDLEEDVADNKIAVEESEKEVADAVKWHNKMLVDYANAIIRLDEARKEV